MRKVINQGIMILLLVALLAASGCSGATEEAAHDGGTETEDGSVAADTGDGGTDGGIADGGTQDGGTVHVDAGPDTGVTDAGIPYYFVAIHNEPYHSSANAAQLRAQSYTILRSYVAKATGYGIRLTIMFSAQLADYIAADPARKAEAAAWKTGGHEFAIHHHSVYHGAWDGYSWYPQADAAYIRSCQGKSGEQYLGTLDDFMAKVDQLGTGIKAGCASDEDDHKELPDAIIHDTCPGFSNRGPVGTRELNDGSPERGRLEYSLKGTVREIERHWLGHFIGFVDIPGAEAEFNDMPPSQVYGTIFHSSTNDEAAFNTYVEFLHAKDPAGSGSRTVSQVIEEKLIPEQTLPQNLVDEVNNACVVAQDGGTPDAGGGADGGAADAGTPDAGVPDAGTTWAKAIGGSDTSKQNYAPSVIVTSGGFVEVGYSNAFSAGIDLDFLVVALDLGGNHLWSRVIGSTHEDAPYTIRQTADSGYVIAGYTATSKDVSDFLIVKLAADGSLEWSRTFDFAGTGDIAYAVRQTADGGYLVAGSTNIGGSGEMKALILKLTATGAVSWAKTVDGGGCTGLELTADDGFVTAGVTRKYGTSADMFVVKYGADGVVQWAETVGGPQLESSNWDGIRQTADGGYIAAGKTRSFSVGGDDDDLFLVKLKPDGTLDWCRATGGAGDDAAWTISQTKDGGFVAGGKMQDPNNPTPGAADILLVRMDAAANLLWAVTLGDDTFQEIEEVKEIDDGYVIAGVTNSTVGGQGDFLMAKLGPDGTIAGSVFSKPHTPAFVSCAPVLTPVSPVTTAVDAQITAADFAVTVKAPALRIDDL
ncbi:MAG: hypothetical protein HY897_00730 [Deltaproteobacteria bacterium]|nr:hypothetical protein [Deltaproteobacteria bacterium]